MCDYLFGIVVDSLLFVMAPSGRGARSHDRIRDMLPLPRELFARQPMAKGCALSRCVIRRFQRRDHVGGLAQEMAEALNHLYCGSSPSLGSSTGQATTSQRLVAQHLHSVAADLGEPPEDLDCRGALVELQGQTPYGDGPSSAVVPLDVSRLSLPPLGFKPVSLSALLGPDEASIIVERLNAELRPKEVVDEVLLNSKCKRVYVDPSLQSRRKYVQFIRLLQSRNLIGFKKRVRSQVGPFAVRKKTATNASSWTAECPVCISKTQIR